MRGTVVSATTRPVVSTRRTRMPGNAARASAVPSTPRKTSVSVLMPSRACNVKASPAGSIVSSGTVAAWSPTSTRQAARLTASSPVFCKLSQGVESDRLASPIRTRAPTLGLGLACAETLGEAAALGAPAAGEAVAARVAAGLG